MKISLFITAIFITTYSIAQNKKSIEALKISKPLSIDGILDEDVYSISIPAKDFVQLQPNNGKPALQNSEVYIFYDQTAIYVGAMLYDEHPDSIFNYLSSRDNIGLSDYFGIYFDPYNQGQLAYGFFINPAGVQTDIKAIKTDHDYEDESWDAVWHSETKVTDKGWVIEMKIPYSNLRFPDRDIHTWGLNMFRNIRRYNSNNSWSFINKQISGFIHQQGELTGIKNIKPPLRLSFTPYAATYIEASGDKTNPEVIYRGGLDVKYGFNESFTLDMMLIPDFGQIQSDDKQLNLSPYELYYDERRQFFTEGTELFNRGDIFYSRRIGARPKFADKAEDSLNENEIIVYNPSSTRLANATKISGRTTNGWGFGFLNAMSLAADSEIKDTITGIKRHLEVQPFTNYNTIVIDKTLENNSYISLINNNMTMANTPFRANVTATEFALRDKKKRYSLNGKGGISNRKNESHLVENGGFANIEIKKDKGNFIYGIEQEFLSKNYNPNDMGYLKRNNRLNTEISTEYAIREPFGIIREIYTGFDAEYNRIVDPGDKINHELGLWTFIRFKNNSVINPNISYSSKTNDYDETRVEGRYYSKSYHISYNFYYQSDFRKKFYYNFFIGGFNHPNTDENSSWIGLGLDTRPNQHLRLEYDINFRFDNNDNGFADLSDDEAVIYFGKRNVETIENELEIDYTFNNKLSLAFRARHYWSAVAYKQFFQLQDDGSLKNNVDYNENNDSNYNIFNIDTTLKWHFAPGSELSLAWKNEIFNEESNPIYGLENNFKNTFESSATNTFSIKILYYIDFQHIKNLSKN